MTIQTPSHPAAADRIEVTHADVVGALQRRSAALLRTSSCIYALKGAPIDAANGDCEADERVRNVITAARLELSLHDSDIADRLRDQLLRIDYFALCAIADDAKRRAHSVDINVDKLNAEHAAARAVARGADAYRAKRQAKRSAYTKAYEAASKLSASQRRQLAQALLDS